MDDVVRQRSRQRLDERLSALKPEARFQPPPKGWIRAVREALGMTGAQFAGRLGISPQSAAALQKSEENGTVQINTLRRAAEALDCRLVYALVPKTSLDDTVRGRARRIALRDIGRAEHTMALEAQSTDNSDLESRIEDYVRTALSGRELWSER